MNLEDKILKVVEEKMNDGSIEKMVIEKLEKGVEKALDDVFGSWGTGTKVIEEQIKSVIVPYLENYDYSQYITKLDSVLVEVLKNTTADNRKILENFKKLTDGDVITKEVKLSDIFEEWKKFVAEDVETYGLEVNYDDYPTYEYVTVTMEAVEEETRSWSSMKYVNVFFECEKDDSLNCSIKLHKWDDKDYYILDSRIDGPLNSLRNLSKFEVYLMKLGQYYTHIDVDTWGETDDVEPESKPEATWE